MRRNDVAALLEGEEITGETIVSDVSGVVASFVTVGYDKSACRQQVDLFVKGEGWFAVDLILYIGHKNTRRGAHR